MKPETAALIQRIDGVAELYRRRLITIEDDAERELVKIFARAEGGVITSLERLLRERRIDVDQATAFLTEVERLLGRVLVTGGTAWVNTEFSIAYEFALDRVRDQYLAGEGLKAGISSLRLIDDDAVRAAFSNFTAADDALFRSGLQRGYSLVKGIDTELAVHLRDTLTRHVALGTDTNTIAAEIMEGGHLKPIRGLTLEARAQMIARTELARISEDASAAKSTQVGIELFRWRAAVGDPRTADDSLRRHGRIKTREQWLAYKPDQFKGVPPMRPRDRCKLLPVRRNWIKNEAARAEFDRAVKEDKRLLVSPEDRRIIGDRKDIPDDFL